MRTCREIKSNIDPALGAVRRIYEATFPASERKPSSCFDEMIRREDYAVVVAEIDAVVVGFAVVFIPATTNDAALLEYLAVAAKHRRHGIGQMLVQRAIEFAGGRPMLVEVESANDPLSVGRREFYRRNGFSTLADYPYQLPLPNAPPMELMLVNAMAPISTRELDRWVKTIFRDVYGANDLPRR